MEELQELLLDNIKDIYDAEKQAVKLMPKLAKSASDSELKEALATHLEQTQNQVTRLEQIFEHLGQKAKSKPCAAMKGLTEEAREHMGEHKKGSVLDSVMIGSAQKMEHYEIAAYGSVRSYAKSLGLKEVANLLTETLKEEEATDKLLTQIGLRVQKDMIASSKASASGDDEPPSPRGGKKVAVKKSAAKEKGTKAAGSKTTTDHDEIRSWAEERGAHPACVRGTGGKGDKGILRLDFPGYSGGDKLQEITWEEFFDKFDDQNLALLYQEATSGGQKSNFNKLVAREKQAGGKSGKGSRKAS